MQTTPKGLRLHIGIFGRRNVGKSSFLNAFTGQEVSIVSDVAGTTTDPVEKAMEILPIGPVLFIDTAGIDDVGALGEMRIEKSRKVIERTDVAVLITDAAEWDDFETEMLDWFATEKLPIIVIFNKTDLAEPNANAIKLLTERKIPWLKTVANQGLGQTDFRQVLIDTMPDEFIAPGSIIGDLVQPGEVIVLVVPIDLEAPKGRLILPQVQTIRDILDSDACCAVVKERELRDMLGNLKKKPVLIVTDSQAFLKVDGDTPPDIPLTSFSILFARFKGDLASFAAGARAIETLKPGDKILMAEGCTHHPIGEDIGRVKIPRWLTQYVGGKLEFDTHSGRDFPDNLSEYKMVIHCGSCTFNRRQLLSRIMQCNKAGVPITNYGMAISYSLGIFDRALAPFPETE
ncbi:MAG: [FeFe] hydrogenase H-cluster maturation GTPase HydF [Kiritimatiellae bacterium]|nr:[FeFe] hydrogenase H-cluster maturation GTPase HydF [Kiritimatiellia bacterium]